MMGHGIDIVMIEKFDKLKCSLSFMNKVFTNRELKYINKSNNNSQTIAGMYALKEAFLKSIKKGINDYALKDIEILHDDNKSPYVILHNDLKKLSLNEVSGSVSHDGEYAIASVIIRF